MSIAAVLGAKSRHEGYIEQSEWIRLVEEQRRIFEEG